MLEQVIIAGFGGQGILSAGKMLAYAGMIENRNVSWLPSYGPEMRGGTANCHVIVSDEPVCSPVISQATAVIVMNRPSIEKFEGVVDHNGIIIIDSSLVDIKPERKDVKVYGVPASQMASDMANVAFANMILLGKLISLTNIVSSGSMAEALKEVLPEKKHYLIPEEMKALEMGMSYR